MKFSGFNTTEKIGIGTNDPGRPLHVRGAGNSSVVRVGDGDTDGAAAIAYIEFGANSTSWNRHSYVGSAGADSHLWIVNEENADILFYANNAEKMVIKNDGNVGINTTAPSAILHIRSSGTARNVFYVAASDNGHLAGIYEESDGRGALNVRNAGGTATINLDSGGNSYFTGGNFGIGTTAPGSLLTISGNSDDGDDASALRIIDEDSTGGSKLPAIMFYGGSTIQGRIRGGDGTFAIAVGSTPTTALSIDTSTRKLTLDTYGSGTHTGTSAYKLSVDSSGNIIETSIGSGAVDGAGTANYISKWTDGDTIGSSIIYDDGTNDVGIGVVPTAVNTSHKSLQIGGNVNIQSYGTKGAGGEVDYCHNVYLNQDGNYKLISADEATMYRQGGGKHNFYAWASGSAGSNVSVNAAATKLIILQDGKVGIGTTAPSVHLDVYTAVGWGVVDIDGASGGELRFQRAGTTHLSIFANHSGSLGSNIKAESHLYLATNNSATPTMTLTSAYKVGIGTTSPATPLHVWSTSYPQFRVSYNSALYFTLDHAATLNVYGNDWYVRLNGSEKFRIKQDGNVGIGTNNPGETLHIYGSIYSRVKIQTTSANSHAILWLQNDAQTWDLRVNGANADNFEIVDSTGTQTSRFVVQTDGNVGIGTTAPSNQLHVYDGSINCYVKVDNGSDNAAGVRFKNPTSEWYVYNTNAAGGGNLRFWENSGSDINFTPAGDVGIGTATPGSYDSRAERLVVHESGDGGITIATGATSDGRLVFARSGDTGLDHGEISYDQNTDHMGFATAGSRRVTIDANGDVGIGGTPVNSPLNVFSDGSANCIRLIGRANGTTDESCLSFMDNDNSTENCLILNVGKDLAFHTNSAERMRLNSSGNLGIGITNPTRTLQVAGAAHATSHLVGSLTTALGIAGSFPDANDSELGPGYLVMTRDDTGAAKQLQFWKNGSLHSGVMTDTNGLNFVGSDGAADVTIKTDGDVGIGTNNPTQQLMVWEGSSSVSLGEYSNGAVIWLDGVNGDLSGGDYFNIWADGNLALRFGYGTGQKVSMLSNGNVGIGTTTPLAKLDIRGDTTTWGGMAKVYLTDTSGHSASRNWSIGNGGTGYGDLNFIVSNALNGVPADSTGTAALVIKNDGKVGIGTTAPGHPLVVVTPTGDKGISLTNSSNVELIHMRQEAGDSGAIGLKDGGNVQVWLTSRPSSNSYFNVSGAKFGIGTNGPSKKLHVSGTTGDNSRIRITDTTNSTNFDIGTDASGGFFSAIEDKHILFYTNGSEKVRIENDGKVGIGTVTPAAQLHIIGPSAASSPYISECITIAPSNIPARTLQLRYDDGGSVGNAFSFAYAGTRAMMMVANGNFGIGNNSSPTQALEIYKAGNDTQVLVHAYGGTNNSTQAGIWFRTDNSSAASYARSKGAVIFQRTGSYGVGNLHLCVQSNANNSSAAVGDSKVVIEQDGNVGIGTNNAAQKLEVNGNILINAQILTPSGSNLQLNPNTGLVTVGGALTATGNITGGAFGPIVFTSSTQSIKWPNTSGQSASRSWGWIGEQGAYGYFQLYRSDASDGTLDTEVMRFRNTGNAEFRNEVTIDGNFNFNGNGTFGTGANGAGNSGSIPAVSHYLRGYSVQYNTGGSGARLTNTGFLTWWTGAGWTSNERMWSFTNAYNMSGSGGPRFALLKGSNNTTIPTLGDNGALGTNTSEVCYWDKDGVFKQNGDINLTGDIGVENGRGVRGPSATEQLILNTTDGIKLTSGGTERVRIQTDGNVGIGTTAPAAMLEVIARASGGHPPLFLRRGANNESASLKLLTTTTEDWIVGMRNDGTSNFRIYSYGASSDVFSILRSSGSVGIGTASPAEKLEVTGNVFLKASGILRLNFQDTSSAQIASLRFNQNPWRLSLCDDSNNERVTLLTQGGSTQGRVGIGITSPIRLLQVYSGTENDVVANFSSLSNSSSAPAAGLTTHIDVGSGHVTNGVARITGHHNLYQDSRSYLSFSTNSGSGVGEKMRIMHDGNVGIGNAATSPSTKLTVQDSGGTALAKIYQTAGTVSAGHDILEVRCDDTSDAGAYNLITANRSGTDVFVVQGDGNVGIGTGAPGDLLHVYGTRPTIRLQGGSGLWMMRSDDNQSHRFEIIDANGGYDKFAIYPGNTGAIVLHSDGAGCVGIGTNTPAQKLHLYNGRIAVSDGYNIGDPESNNGMFISGDSVQWQTGGTTRLKLDSSGHLLPVANGTYNLGSSSARWANTYSVLGNFSGDVTINSLTIASGSSDTIYANRSVFGLRGNTSVNLMPGGTTRLLCNSSGITVTGNIIPAADGTYNLGSTSSQDWKELYIREIDMYNQRLRIYTSAEKVIFRDHTSIGQGITFQARATEVMTIGDASGNARVGIGTSSPAAKLHVYGGGITLANNQILSVGTGASNSSGKVRLYGGSGTAYYMDYQPVGTQDRNFRFNGSSSGSAYTTYFNQQGSGNHNLYVDGDITSAGTGRYIYAVNLNVTGYKNFEIEHPTKENMMLVHSSLEGPEAGVYYRGRAQSDTITLPDYWTGLVRDGTITVQLTPNGSFQHLYVVSTSLSEIKIGAAEGETIDCYYIIYGERADVAPLVVEDAAAWERFQERKSAMSDGKA